MHVGIRYVDPPVVAPRQRDEGAGEADPAGTWAIEELPSAPPQHAPITARDRRVMVALALGALLIVFGLVGHWLDQGVPPGAAANRTPPVAVVAAPTQAAAVPAATLAPRAEPASLALWSPDEGATIEGAVVPVSVLARQPVGTLHLAIVLAHGAAGPDTELGATDVEVDAAGAVATRIAVFAPQVSLPVELVVSSPGGPAEPVALRRAFTLRPTGPVQLWRSEVIWSDDAWTLAIAGEAPLVIRSLQIRVSDSTGALLAEQRAANGGRAGPSGAAGGHALGLGSFGGRLSLARAQAGDLLTLRVSWRDPSVDETGSETVQVLVPGPELHPCPHLIVQGGAVVRPEPVSEAGSVQSVALGAPTTWCRYVRKR